MVSASITNTARQTTQTLQNRDVEGVAVIALSAAGGVIVSQLIAEEVASIAGVDSDPNSGLKSLVAVAGTKLAVAGGFAFVGASVGGLGLVAAAFMGIGALASAGADALDYAVNSSPLSGSQVGAPSARAASATARAPSASASMDREEVQYRSHSSAHGGTKRPDSSRESFR